MKPTNFCLERMMNTYKVESGVRVMPWILWDPGQHMLPPTTD